MKTACNLRVANHQADVDRMRDYRVLVIGGYGFFGRRLVERLSRFVGLQVIVAGRSATKGLALASALQPLAASNVSIATLDVSAPDFSRQLAALSPHVVIHTSGPFQGQQYQVAQACISAGAHYIDLADGREFVSGISALDTQAAAAGVAVISGASSVPGLSSAVADHLAVEMVRIHHIDIGISPGNRTERGLSTVRAILSYCGKPLPTTDESDKFGWSGHRWHHYPDPVGKRLLSPCDVPDLVLLPQRYHGMPSVRFGAGLELAVLHRGMNLMASLTRMGLVADWTRYATLLKRTADMLKNFGSNAGAMHVCVNGDLPLGGNVTRSWHLVAAKGDGPYVPTLAAAALVRKLQSGRHDLLGARPCVGLLTVADFVAEMDGLHVKLTESFA